jgi:hypothetical protein
MAHVLVLLPPSEGKTAPAAGPALDLARISLPALTPARTRVLDALTRLARSDPDHARAVLGLSARQAGEIGRNAALHRAPTAPAAEVYTGVLFAALDAPTATEDVRQRLASWVLVWSGLWGVVRLDDPIPAYRLSGAVALPGPGRLSSYWRGPLAAVLDEVAASQVVLDLRSGTYASTWSGPAGRTVVGRVLHEHDGRRTVASHFNKATKGRLVRALAAAGADPDTPEALVEAVRAAGFRAELAAGDGTSASRKGPRGGSGGRGHTILDIIVGSP